LWAFSKVNEKTWWWEEKWVSFIAWCWVRKGGPQSPHSCSVRFCLPAGFAPLHTYHNTTTQLIYVCRKLTSCGHRIFSASVKNKNILTLIFLFF